MKKVNIVLFLLIGLGLVGIIVGKIYVDNAHEKEKQVVEVFAYKNSETLDNLISIVRNFVSDKKANIKAVKGKFEKKEEKPKETTEKNTSSTNQSTYATSIAVLNYHFFYDEKTESCNESICLSKTMFEKHLQYFRDNGFKTLTMEEYRAWMYGEINLPKKSVLITVDDGAMGTGKTNGNILGPLLQKYNAHATLFLITGWWDKSNYETKNLEIESHGDLLHEDVTCDDGSTKYFIACRSKEAILKDLQTSISKLNSKKAFCYPFYTYNSKTISAVKESGFKLAFIGGNRKSKRSDDKYKIPRYVIHKTTSVAALKNMVN